MPWENIGHCGGGQLPQDRDWILFQMEMAISYLRHVCGEEPKGCKLDIMWHEHELGDYPSVGLCWEYEDRFDAPWEYLRRCEIALELFNDSVDWSAIAPKAVEELFEDKDDDFGKHQEDIE